MLPVEVHLALNHVPVLASLGGFVLLLIAALRRDPAMIRLSLAVFVVAALFAIPVFLTGEPAEEAVEHVAGVVKAEVDPHQDAARVALIAVEVLGVVSLGTLILRRKRPTVPGAAVATILFLSLVTSGVMAWTATLGGRIHHPELRPGYTQQQAPDSAPGVGEESD